MVPMARDRKSTRLNSSHEWSSDAVFCLKKKNRTGDLYPADRLSLLLSRRFAHFVADLFQFAVVEPVAAATGTFIDFESPFGFFFNDTPTTDIYTLSLHDALPI